ncbi:hypothetical protein [Variovorax guangxiensis]|uniref:hypothetical protein n=1 Tax=Variovorax guangxiensis TaxID=1775474 RepID=UPI00285C1BFF|nr:hypothetical protein [Variovorax guangxiensis]MDR6856212.1 hypothetical protein [Variovorax guangxiensis]
MPGEDLVSNASEIGRAAVAYDETWAVALAAACGIAALLAILGLAAWRTAPERAPAPIHGAFVARSQPVLEGIGSTRDLTPVPLGEADEVESSPSGGRTARTDRHEPRSRRR